MRLKRSEVLKEVTAIVTAIMANRPELKTEATQISEKVADYVRTKLEDALSQANGHVYNLGRRYGNSNMERMTDHTMRMIQDTHKKVSDLWEEASGRRGYDGTPIEQD